MKTQQKSRRGFLYATGAAGLLAAGASTIPLTTLAQQIRLSSLWPARVPGQGRGAGPLPSLSYRVYAKLGFGARPDNPANPGNAGDLDYFDSLGGNRLQNWLNEQLSPGADPEVDSRINGNSHYQTVDKSLTQLWNDHYRYEGPDSWQIRNRPYWEMQMLTLTRMVHSRWQLREVLADFWHNHFNVDGSEDAVRSVLTSYDRDVIRTGLFGNFRNMLENVIKHAAMMYYLDNRRNSSPNPNENYARELLELHTLGAVENYYGFIPAAEVPSNSDGEPAGYVEEDVLEMARLLTGFGIADDNDFPAGSPQNNGQFLFRPDWHDNDPKTIMGQVIPATGQSELDTILDYLASHRGTAEYICWKLVVRLIGDSFSASSPLVQSAADVFQNNWQAGDQLTQVYQHLILSTEFQSTWADKARRPLEIVSSAMRAANVPFNFELNSADTDAGFNGFYWTFNRIGQLPHNCEPPTGYPEDRAIWKGSGPLIMSWRAISRMLRDMASQGSADYVNLAQLTNDAGIALTPSAIADFWLDRVLGPNHNVSAAKRIEMVGFLANNGNAPGDDQPLSINTGDTSEWSTYQKLMRGLFLLVALLPERMIR